VSVSRITFFIRYTQNQKIGKAFNLKYFGAVKPDGLNGIANNRTDNTNTKGKKNDKKKNDLQNTTQKNKY